MTPWEDLFFVINNLLLGEEPVSSVLLIIQLIILMTFLSVDRRFHPPGRNQRGLRSIHTLVLLSHWTKGQFGRIGALVNTGRAGPRVHWYLIRSLDRYFLVLIEKATVFQRPGGESLFWILTLNFSQLPSKPRTRTCTNPQLYLCVSRRRMRCTTPSTNSWPPARAVGNPASRSSCSMRWTLDIQISWYPDIRYPDIHRYLVSAVSVVLGVVKRIKLSPEVFTFLKQAANTSHRMAMCPSTSSFMLKWDVKILQKWEISTYLYYLLLSIIIIMYQHCDRYLSK